MRDEKTLARPWAKPGTPGLEHRLGGLEKQADTGNVSYDPANHEYMTHLREAKVQRVTQDMPPLHINGDDSGDVLIIGWGSTRGAIESAVERAHLKGQKVSSIHLRYVWPLPADLGEVISRFEHHLVPELNNGQLVRLLRDRFVLPFTPLNKIQGQPFRSSEIEAKVDEILTAA